MRHTWTRPCLLHHPTHPFAPKLRRVQLQRTGPGPSGAVSIIQLLHPDNDPRIRWIMQGDIGVVQTLSIPPSGGRPAGKSASGCNTTTDAPTAGEERGGGDAIIKPACGPTERRMQQSTHWNGGISSDWPKFGFHICSLRSQLPLMMDNSLYASNIKNRDNMCLGIERANLPLPLPPSSFPSLLSFPSFSSFLFQK